MYVIAIIGDLLGAIPIVNIVSDVATAIALGVAGAETGVSLYSSKRIGWTLVAILITAIPIPLPKFAWTMRVYFAKKDARKSEG